MVKVVTEPNMAGITQDKVVDRDVGISITGSQKVNGKTSNLSITQTQDGVTRTLTINEDGRMTLTDANGTNNIAGDGKKYIQQWEAAKKDSDLNPGEVTNFANVIANAKGGHDKSVANEAASIAKADKHFATAGARQSVVDNARKNEAAAMAEVFGKCGIDPKQLCARMQVADTSTRAILI